LAQFAKEKQRVAEAATGANRPHAELARPRIIPHPEAGTIEFEHGQIVAKMGRRVGQVKEGFHPSPILFTLRGCRMMRKRSRPVRCCGIDPVEIISLRIRRERLRKLVHCANWRQKRGQVV
jgi:hypothetical protein